MNNNPGETPNPLNGGSVNSAGPSVPPQASAGVQADGTVPPAPTITPVASLDPTGRPMAQKIEAPASPAKKLNKGLIAGIIIGCVLLIGGIVAAVLLMVNANKGDAVAAAMQRIMSGEAPKNVAIDGSINILLNDEDSPIKRINVDLDSDIMVGSMINTSSAVLTFTDQNNKDYSVKVNEVYAANDDLYFEIEGAKDAMKESGLLNMMSGGSTETKCIGDNSGDTKCETPVVVDCGDDEDCTEVEVTAELDEVSSLINNAIISIVESIDGVYLKISAEELNLLKEQSLDNNSEISCITDLVSSLNKNSISTVQLYNKHPFIASTSEKIPITSKQNPIYQIWVDDESFADYVNDMKDTEVARSLYSCMDWDDNATITKDDVAKITRQMPNIYAEVNNENNFTRLYLESDINDGSATATIDLGFSYPTNINVSEPVEYKDFSEFIQTLMTTMYSIED